MKAFRIAVILGALAFPLGVGINALRFEYGFNDAYWRTLMTLFEGTVWAPGFSEAAFSEIKVGMPSDSVTALLGEPLRKSCNVEGCLWLYTWQDTGTADFDQRWLDFDPAGRVKEIRKSFYID